MERCRAQRISRRRQYRRRRIGCVLLVLAITLAAAGWKALSGAGQLPAAAAEDYITVTRSREDIYRGSLALVSNANPWPFPSDQELVGIYEHKNHSYHVRDTEIMLAAAVMEPLNAWLQDFASQGGSPTINVVAGYRSYDYQRQLYADSLRERGAAHTARFIAQPGGSEHHTGLALDLALYYLADGSSGVFDGAGEYRWLTDNACNYGFIRRYRADKESYTAIADEPWHFRYVGRPHAEYMTVNDLCLEEYLEMLTAYDWTAPLAIAAAGESYLVYYAKGARIPLPSEGNYTVSGDGQRGFIVTVQL